MKKISFSYFLLCIGLVESVALLALSGLLREETDDFISSEAQYMDNENSTGVPIIVYSGEDPFKCKDFDVYADNVKVLSVKSMAQAFAALVAVFFVFNIAYPKSMLKTLTFLQKVFIGLQDSLKKPQPVVTLLTNLNRH